MNKKILVGLISGLVLLALALPVFAQETVPEKCKMKVTLTGSLASCPNKDTDSQFDKNYLNDEESTSADAISGAICCMFSAVYYAVNWIFTILMLVVLVLTMVGGFLIVTAGGNPDNVTKGKNFIMFAAMGLAVALLSRAVPILVKYITGL